MPAEALSRQLQKATQRCLEQAHPLVAGQGRRLPDIQIRCDLRGLSAGQMRLHANGRFEIRYNLDMALQQPQRFLNETVPHEVAHLVTWLLHGSRVRPHGKEWQAVMRGLGVASPKAYHDFEPAGNPRRQRRWHYRCSCREHQLSTTRHNRIIKGMAYTCTRCGELLARVTRR